MNEKNIGKYKLWWLKSNAERLGHLENASCKRHLRSGWWNVGCLVIFDGQEDHRAIAGKKMNGDLVLFDEANEDEALRAAVEQAGFVNV